MNNSNPNRPKPDNARQDQSKISSLTQENPTESNAIQIPEISLPKGGGALKGIEGKFEVNSVNVTMGFNIHFPIKIGRDSFSILLLLNNSPVDLTRIFLKKVRQSVLVEGKVFDSSHPRLLSFLSFKLHCSLELIENLKIPSLQ